MPTNPLPMRCDSSHSSRSIKISFIIATLLVALAVTCIPQRSRAAAHLVASFPTVMFATQPPFPIDRNSINGTFGNHRTDTGHTPRGGDLYIRYGDGSLRNLTAEAGYGLLTGQEIAVREPCVHWSGTKALFAMVIGGTTPGNSTPVYWQIYEVTGIGQGQPAQITKLAQPANSNNVSPIYGTDDQIIFTSDRPRNGDQLLYPQLDEYQADETVTGIWKMNADGSNLRVLDHTPSGAFTPTLDSFGRIIYTRWDHLERDVLSKDGTQTTNQPFNYVSEASAQQTALAPELFPEPSQQPPGSFWFPFEFNLLLPWMMNEDGTGLETLNHVGRHELLSAFNAAHQGLPAFTAPAGHRTMHGRMLQIKEDPTQPGYFYGTAALEFTTHSAGQIIALNAPDGFNPDNMQVDFITDPNTEFPINTGQQPPANYAGHFRNPTPLSDGTLVAVQTTYAFAETTTPVSNNLTTGYNFRLVTLQAANPYRTPGARLIPNGIVKTISYWDNTTSHQVSFTGQMWELDPVEVRVRTRPAPHSTPMPSIETQILAQELGGQPGIDDLKQWLIDNNLALVVSRNVTRRADRQQDFNLKIFGSATVTADPGATPVDIEYLQFFQGDLLRGYNNLHAGRRPLAQPMHDGFIPTLANAPPGSIALGTDGSMAAFIPARRAMTWQLTKPDGSPLIRERYWVTFAPGEMRTCTNCHGINTGDVVLNQPAPTNPPQALHDLANWYFNTVCRPVLAAPSQYFRASGGSGGVSVNAGSQCNWAVTSNDNWITLTSTSNGTGNDTVTFEVRENFTGAARTGTLSIGGKTFTVFQDGGLGASCNYSISPLSSAFSAGGGTGNIAVLSNAACAWKASSNVNWVTITSGHSGIGNGSVTYTVAPNTGSDGRKGVITVAGQTFAIKQKGG